MNSLVCFSSSSFSLVCILFRKRSEIIQVFSKQSQTILNLSMFNPFPNKPWFLRVCRRSLLKTLWEKEKLLIFLASCVDKHGFQGGFCLLENFLLFSSNLKLSSANSFNLEESKICRLEKGQLFTKQQNFRPVQIESICRRQNECD